MAPDNLRGALKGSLAQLEMLRSKLWIHWTVWAPGAFPGLSQFRLGRLLLYSLTLRKREDGNCWCEATQWFVTACPALRINRGVVHIRYSLGIQEIWVQLPALLQILWSLASPLCKVGINNNSLSLPCVIACNDFKEKRNSSSKRGYQISVPLGTKKHWWYNSTGTMGNSQSDKEKQHGIQGRTRTECKTR